MTAEEAYGKATQTSANLQTDDYRFDQMAVHIITKSGTSLFYPEAFVERHEDWWTVFTRNFGFIILHTSDLLNDEVKEYMKI